MTSILLHLVLLSFTWYRPGQWPLVRDRLADKSGQENDCQHIGQCLNELRLELAPIDRQGSRPANGFRMATASKEAKHQTGPTSQVKGRHLPKIRAARAIYPLPCRHIFANELPHFGPWQR